MEKAGNSYDDTGRTAHGDLYTMMAITVVLVRSSKDHTGFERWTRGLAGPFWFGRNAGNSG
jgi:hypothetical protein